MRSFTLALALGAFPAAAIPATAFGQGVSCPDCRHVASYFRGEGGFIGTVADGAGEVVFVASCGNVSITGEVGGTGGGTAAQLFNHRNGLACDRDDGSLEIAGLKDGGWFWITDDMNSAVGGLVAKDVLKNDAADITSAGAGVTMTKGKGAVYLKEAASGRVGILPNILPEPPVKPLRKCGATGAGTARSAGKKLTTGCALGDGKTILLVTGSNTINGTTERIHDKGTVPRPATGATGTVVLTADLWGNGSGHFFTGSDLGTNGINAFRGDPARAMTSSRAATRYVGVGYTVRQGSGPGGGAISEGGDGSTTGGVSYAVDQNAATITIRASASHCPATGTKYTQTISLTATMASTDADGAGQVTPSIVRAATGTPAGKVGSTSFTVVCPGAAANMGQELVPENPFPVD